jgi:hypothetical protein
MYEIPNMFHPHKWGSLVECFQMNTMKGIYTQYCHAFGGKKDGELWDVQLFGCEGLWARKIFCFIFCFEGKGGTKGRNVLKNNVNTPLNVDCPTICVWWWGEGRGCGFYFFHSSNDSTCTLMCAMILSESSYLSHLY